MRDNFAEINVVPLVDVMLVLIVIVLVTANFMVRGVIHVNLPTAESGQNTTQAALHLEMAKDGSVYLDERKIDEAQLVSRLSGESRDKNILISADRELPIQPFVTMVDLLKKQGFNRISVQTEK
ncbi:MAG: biopolymer transporter ExbD [Oxalobacter sp.]|nr:biopolymer transporter ExbD [Oxalobacter sp.]